MIGPSLIYLSGGYLSVAPYIPVGDLLGVRHHVTSAGFPG